MLTKLVVIPLGLHFLLFKQLLQNFDQNKAHWLFNVCLRLMRDSGDILSLDDLHFYKSLQEFPSKEIDDTLRHLTNSLEAYEKVHECLISIMVELRQQCVVMGCDPVKILSVDQIGSDYVVFVFKV